MAGLSSGLWRLDRLHSSLTFSVPYLGISRIRGRFDSFDATLTVEDDRQSASCAFTVDAKSVDTGRPDIDDLLRSADFFDVASHPTHRFWSTSIEPNEQQQAIMGHLTMNGIKQAMYLTMAVRGPVRSPAGRLRAGLALRGAVSRSAYGLRLPQNPLTASLPDADLITIASDLTLVHGETEPHH